MQTRSRSRPMIAASRARKAQDQQHLFAWQESERTRPHHCHRTLLPRCPRAQLAVYAARRSAHQSLLLPNAPGCTMTPAILAQAEYGQRLLLQQSDRTRSLPTRASGLGKIQAECCLPHANGCGGDNATVAEQE